MQKQKALLYPASLWADVIIKLDDAELGHIYNFIFTNTDRGIYRPNESDWRVYCKSRMNKFTFLDRVQSLIDTIIVLENGNWLLRDFLARTHKPSICLGKKPCDYCKGALKLYKSNGVNFNDLQLDNIRIINIDAYLEGQLMLIDSAGNNTDIAGNKLGSKERLSLKVATDENIELTYTDTGTIESYKVINFLQDPKGDWPYLFKECKVSTVTEKKHMLQEFIDYIIGRQLMIHHAQSYLIGWAADYHKRQIEATRNVPKLNNRTYGKGSVAIDITKPLPGETGYKKN